MALLKSHLGCIFLFFHPDKKKLNISQPVISSLLQFHIKKMKAGHVYYLFYLLWLVVQSEFATKLMKVSMFFELS